MKTVIHKVVWCMVLVCSFCASVSCSNGSDDVSDASEAGRVVLAYLVANNNLDANLINNVVWMYRGLARADKASTLLVYYKGRRNLTTPTILRFRTNGRGKINGKDVLAESEQSVANVLAQAECIAAVDGNAVNKDIMKANLQKMQSLAPASHYALIFASHATGWLPSSGSESRSFGNDNSYEIDIPDMAQALRESFPQHNVDFILFDACMMGTAEVCYELRDVAHYCMVSVMEVPSVGFPYYTFMDKLYADDVDLRYVCDQTVAYNKSNGLWGTYAVIDCGQMERLAEQTKVQLMRHRTEWKQLDYDRIQQYGLWQNKLQYFSFDLAEVMKKLNGGAELPDSYRQTLDKAVVYKTCVGTIENPKPSVKPWAEVLDDESKYCGLGIYLPGMDINTSWDAYLPSLAWYQAAGWETLLATE